MRLNINVDTSTGELIAADMTEIAIMTGIINRDATAMNLDTGVLEVTTDPAKQRHRL